MRRDERPQTVGAQAAWNHRQETRQLDPEKGEEEEEQPHDIVLPYSHRGDAREARRRIPAAKQRPEGDKQDEK